MIRKDIKNHTDKKEVGLEYDLSSNITLRKYLESDADTIIKWITDERALTLWSADRYGDFPIKADDINNNYTECISKGSFYPMTLVDGDKIIGHMILRNPDGNKDIIRLGFIIVDPAIRGKGYGKLIIKKAIEYAKNVLHAKEINLGVFANNTNAYNCYKAAGFKEIGIDKNVMQFQNESWDCVEMKLV